MASEAFLKGGDMRIHDLSFPTNKEPSSAMVMEVTVSNGALPTDFLVPPFLTDPDRCDPGFAANPGFNTEVIFDVDWLDENIVRGPACIPSTEIGSWNTRFEADVTVPDSPGNYRIRARMHMPTSDTYSDWIDGTLSVSEDPAEEPPDDEDGGGDNGDENGDGNDGFNLTKWAVNHPVEAGLGVIVGSVALRSAIQGDD